MTEYYTVQCGLVTTNTYILHQSVVCLNCNSISQGELFKSTVAIFHLKCAKDLRMSETQPAVMGCVAIMYQSSFDGFPFVDAHCLGSKRFFLLKLTEIALETLANATKKTSLSYLAKHSHARISLSDEQLGYREKGSNIVR